MVYEDTEEEKPLFETTWTDPVTGRQGFLVIHTLVGGEDVLETGLTTGGTRMRAGCSLPEVKDLARGMAYKTAAFDLPPGGAKGGIDIDPNDPEASALFGRYVKAMRSWLDKHWVTAEDLGVTQELIDSVFAKAGLDQSFHAAIQRSADREATLKRVKAGLATEVEGGLLLGDVIGGYGVSEATLSVIDNWGWNRQDTTVAIQGIGTMGGGTAWYLHLAGVKVITVADIRGVMHHPDGLNIPELLNARDDKGIVDRSKLSKDVHLLDDRDAIIPTTADILVPAAAANAITALNAHEVNADVIVEAANGPVSVEAEQALLANGTLVIPDFIANAGAVAWAWWLLQAQVGTDPQVALDRLSGEMSDKVGKLLAAWNKWRTPPRSVARKWVDKHSDSKKEVIIP